MPESQAKLPPGPWKCYPSSESDGHYQVFDANGDYLTTDDEVHEAVATAIKHVPELLAALGSVSKDLAAAYEIIGNSEVAVVSIGQWGRLGAAVSILSKAKGEPQ